MDPIVWVIILVIAAVAAAALVVALRQRQRAQLQQRFGPEYERAVERSGSRRDAEHELSSVASRRDKLEIRELDPAAKARWVQQWDVVQARFVDAPAEAVGSASSLITSLMHELGYPTDDFDERAALVAADHPHVVEHYREAQSAYDRHRRSGEGDTEDLRQSFVHYRQLFEALVQPGVSDHTDHTDHSDHADHTDRADQARADVPRSDADHTVQNRADETYRSEVER